MKVSNYKTAASFQHDFGRVSLTQSQLDWLIDKVKGEGRIEQRGSTHSAVIDKVRTATRWDMKAEQLLCRFAYVNGIVRL